MTEYLIPESIQAATEALADSQGLIMGGGTDLMIELRRARLKAEGGPVRIVDVTRIPELNKLDPDAEEPYIGAAVSYHHLATDPEVKALYPVLAQASASVGSLQIRQTGTLGGNVATGSPAGDGVCALAALGTRVELASAEGRRMLPLEEVITGPYRTAIRPEELIVGFHLDRLPENAGQYFHKVGRRQAVAVARLNIALVLDQDLSEPRIVLGSCFPSPRRLTEIEAMVIHGQPGPGLWAKAGETAAGEFVNVCGLRSSAEYKLPAIKRCLALALKRAWAEARGGS